VLDDTPIQLARYCSLRAERQRDMAIIRLAGEFDLGCEKRFQAELESALDNHVGTFVLDLRGLTFIDSTGLGLLVQIDALARNDGFDFAVVCGNGQVRRVFEQTGLDGVLPLIDHHEEVPAADSPV
jgi:anti-sigma B factor antagonist